MNAAVGYRKVAPARMIAREAYLEPIVGCRILPAWNRPRSVDASHSCIHGPGHPEYAIMRAWTSPGDLPDHQRFAGAVRHVTNAAALALGHHPIHHCKLLGPIQDRTARPLGGIRHPGQIRSSRILTRHTGTRDPEKFRSLGVARAEVSRDVSFDGLLILLIQRLLTPLRQKKFGMN